MMIVSVVICPSSPFLVPGLADGLRAGADDLVRAVDRAMTALDGVGRVVLIGTAAPGGRTWVRDPGTLVTAAGLARSDRDVVSPVRLPDGVTHDGDVDADGHGADSGGAAAPASGAPTTTAVGTAVGATLLARAGLCVPTTAVESGECDPFPRRVIPEDEVDTGVLVMADGAACHGDDAPGGDDPRAVAFDEALAAAARSGDPAALADTVAAGAGTAAELRAETVPAWRALAVAVADRPRADADLLYAAAPYGIGYLVATWRWAGRR